MLSLRMTKSALPLTAIWPLPCKRSKRAKREGRLFDLSKRRVERGIKQALVSMLTSDTHTARESNLGKELKDEDRYNLKHRQPKVHAMLARSGLTTPAKLTPQLFKDHLNVDLADPYLGLAPYVLGGKVGRN